MYDIIMLRHFLMFLFLLFPTSVFAQCNNFGGELSECSATYGSLHHGHPVPPGEYHSAATFIIKNAGCISTHTRFGFHSSYAITPYGKAPSADGNAYQLQQFNQYPLLQTELLARRVFNSLRLTFFNGLDISRLTGIPPC